MEQAQDVFNGLEAMFRAALKKDPDNLEVKEALEEMTRNKNAGTAITVDRASGFVLGVDCGGRIYAMTNFKWLSNIPDDLFDIDDREWTDYTKPLIEEQPGDCALLVKAQHVAEAKTSIHRNLLKVDLATGKSRRVPCRIGPASAGCFSKDRTKVYAAAIDIDMGLHRIIEVDLESGENRDICEGLLEGMTIYPAISPDGSKLSVLNRGKGMDLQHTQLCVIDLATRQVTKVGQPGNYIAPRWLPGDAGFSLIKYRPNNAFNDQKILCRMDLDGKLQEFRPSGMARPLGKLPKILFEFERTGHCMTCDFDGKNEEYLPGDPSDILGIESSIDGKHILILKRNPKGIQFIPCVAELATGKVTMLLIEEGYWALAGW